MDVRCVVAVVAGAPIMARCGHGAESAVMVPVRGVASVVCRIVE